LTAVEGVNKLEEALDSQPAFCCSKPRPLSRATEQLEEASYVLRFEIAATVKARHAMDLT
jgi:hypothetical protein